MKKYDYDYFVIGGGSGGLSSAKKAASYGAKVGLADFVRPSPKGTTWGLGGTCVNVGCIPKKLMHFTSHLGEIRHDQKQAGWDVDITKPHNWSNMLSQVNGHIKSLNWGYKSELLKKEIDFFNAYATLKNEHIIMLKNENGEISEVTADKILIAVGGRPNYLNVEGSRELCITSDDIFWQKEAPGKTLVIGAGYIGLECGGFVKGLGNDVDVLYRSEVLRGFDQNVRDRLVNYMTDFGMNFVKGSPLGFFKKDGKVMAKLQLGDVVEERLYDTVLLAIGRTPDTKSLNLDKIGVKLSPKGKLIVNEKWQTNIENIYAVGDINSHGLELTPVAIKEGKYLAEGLFTGNWQKINYSVVPTTVFTPLEYSFCGLTEEAAIKKYTKDKISIYHSAFKPLEWNMTWDHPSNACYSKIIILKEERTILGIHYLGPNAGEVMQGFAVVVRLGLKYEDVSDTIGIHPTTAEELVTFEFTKEENPDANKEGC